MKASEVKDVVTWLSQDGRFKYGGLDVEVCNTATYDFIKPLIYHIGSFL